VKSVTLFYQLAFSNLLLPLLSSYFSSACTCGIYCLHFSLKSNQIGIAGFVSIESRESSVGLWCLRNKRSLLPSRAIKIIAECGGSWVPFIQLAIQFDRKWSLMGLSFLYRYGGVSRHIHTYRRSPWQWFSNCETFWSIREHVFNKRSLSNLPDFFGFRVFRLMCSNWSNLYSEE